MRRGFKGSFNLLDFESLKCHINLGMIEKHIFCATSPLLFHLIFLEESMFSLLVFVGMKQTWRKQSTPSHRSAGSSRMYSSKLFKVGGGGY